MKSISPRLPWDHFSSFNRLKRDIVDIQRAIERTRLNKQHNWRLQEGPPLVAELSKAEDVILRSLQHHHFQSEIQILRKLDANNDHFQDSQNARERNNIVKSISNLYKLDPFPDKEGLLRVGGRLKNSVSLCKIKHSFVVPRDCFSHTPVSSREVAPPRLCHDSQCYPPSWILHHKWPF